MTRFCSHCKELSLTFFFQSNMSALHLMNQTSNVAQALRLFSIQHVAQMSEERVPQCRYFALHALQCILYVHFAANAAIVMDDELRNQVVREAYQLIRYILTYGAPGVCHHGDNEDCPFVHVEWFGFCSHDLRCVPVERYKVAIEKVLERCLMQ